MQKFGSSRPGKPSNVFVTNSNMKLTPETIQARLKAVEKEHRVRILYACESGSRAWGFESQDSDYDIRFLYVRNIDDYITLEALRDVGIY